MATSLALILFALVYVFGVGWSITEDLPETYYEFEGREDTVKSADTAFGAFPRTAYFFPNIEQTTNYIRVTPHIPPLDEFTVCGTFSFFSKGTDALVSYATFTGKSNEHDRFLIIRHPNEIEIAMNMEAVREGLELASKTWIHICVTSFASTGTSYIFIDGILREITNTKSAGPVKQGGQFIIGQKQGIIGGDFDPDQSFQGLVYDFMLWKRALEPGEITKMYQNRCHCPQDYLFTLERNNIEMFGGITTAGNLGCMIKSLE